MKPNKRWFLDFLFFFNFFFFFCDWGMRKQAFACTQRASKPFKEMRKAGSVSMQKLPHTFCSLPIFTYFHDLRNRTKGIKQQRS